MSNTVVNGKREILLKDIERLSSGDEVTVSEFGITMMAEVKNVEIFEDFVKLTLNIFTAKDAIVITKFLPRGVEVPTYGLVYADDGYKY